MGAAPVADLAVLLMQPWQHSMYAWARERGRQDASLLVGVLMHAVQGLMHMLMLGSDWYGGHKSNLQVKQKRILGHESMMAMTSNAMHVLFHWDLERVAASVLSCPCACVCEACK
jgi:hypothetical protein